MAQLLGNLPVGAKVKFGKYQVGSETPWGISWVITAKSHIGYPANSVTILTEKIVDERAFDANEPNSEIEGRRTGGNNRYSVSNIDQWLNSLNAEWYTSRHATDTPPSAENLHSAYATMAYADKKGFLYHFANNERNVILDTTIQPDLDIPDGGGTEVITRKVFLPSLNEVYESSRNSLDGSTWEFFLDTATLADRTCVMFPQTFNNIASTTKPGKLTETWSWWTRTAPATGAGTRVYDCRTDNTVTSDTASLAFYGVRPALNLSSSLKVSDTTDSDGCYTFILNSAPPKPSTINLPNRILGGKANSISWSSVVDPEGDGVTYQLECSYDAGATYSTLYTGSAISYVHMVTYGKTSIMYRVKAVDSSNESSAYITSANVTIVNNNPPAISGSDINLGVKSDDFTGTYTVTDVNSDTVTVTEAIDGVQIRALVVKLGETITYGISGTTWLALPNGSHTLTISATDGIDTTVRTIVFTKLVDKFTIRNSTPWVSSTMPTRIMLVITRNIPTTSKFKVEVCNNGYDTSPTWEDCTDAVKSGLVHVFTNTSKTATNWGVLVRVTVERNGAVGACYISAIGGNFE